MLSKLPEERPRDGAAALAELAALSELMPRSGVGAAGGTPSVLTAREQRLLSVIVAAGEGVPRSSEAADTVTASQAALWHELDTIVARHEGHAATRTDGALLVLLRSTGAATDLAARVARCALTLRERLPEARLAIATGQGVAAGAHSTGSVIDTGIELIRQEGLGEGIGVDDVTAGLLDGRFVVRRASGTHALVGEASSEDTTRLLLGRRAPLVGRDHELAVLERWFDATIRARGTRAVLVEGAPGIGKSRLARELVTRLATRAEPPAIWWARGDPMRTGSPFGLLGPAIRRLFAIQEGDPLSVQRQKLEARLAERVASAELLRVCEFLGELVAIPFLEQESPQLRAGRRDPLLMADQIRRAWEDWVTAESGQRPLVLLLEDLHWADLASIKLLEGLLRRRAGPAGAGCCIFILALARPEVHQRFPALWNQRDVQQLRLTELSQAASESLVRAVLGERIDGQAATELAQLAAGNALYLEELIRATAEGRRSGAPATVLAMLAARLEGLEPDARRVLRAASILGPAFWSGSLERLLGGAAQAPELSRWLEASCSIHAPRVASPPRRSFASITRCSAMPATRP
jgi:hypothetical protein